MCVKGLYLIPACLPYIERRKIANVFTLCLGPHRHRDMPTDFIVLHLAQLFVYYFLDIPYLFAIGNVMEQIEGTGAKMEDPSWDWTRGR